MDDEVFKVVAVNRDAVETNRGFYFQYLNVLKKWVSNFVDEEAIEVYTEVDDDIKEVGDNLVFTQIKCYSSTFNLNSKEIKKAVYNFFLLFLRYRTTVSELKFAFECNSAVGKREKLLINWMQRSSSPDASLETAFKSRIKNMLGDEIKRSRQTKLSIASTSDEKKDVIKSAYNSLNEHLKDDILLEFISRIDWNFSNQKPEEAIQKILGEIRILLSHEKFQGKPIDVLLNALLSEIYYCSQNRDKARRVLQADILQGLLSKTEEELTQYANQKLVALFGVNLNKLSAAISDLQKEQLIQRSEIDTLLKAQVTDAEMQPPQEITELPFIDRLNIVGRDQAVLDVYSLLNDSKHVAICGPIGIGKTTFAKLFLNSFRDRYKHIIWINGADGLLNALVFNEGIAMNLQLSFSKNENISYRFRTIFNSLNSLTGDNLLIIDNFQEDFATIEPLLSLKCWQILTATRSQLNNIRTYKLDQLSENDALQLYQKYDTSSPDIEIIREFLLLIDTNTLVIELTAKTIANSLDFDLAKFMVLLKNQQLDDSELEIEIEVGTSSQTTRLLPFLESTFALVNLSDHDGILLEFCALLPPEIRITDLILMCGKEFEKQNKTSFVNLFNKLHANGWVERKGDQVKIHRILQDVIIYKARKRPNPFTGHFLFIGWLIARFQEGFANDPVLSVRFLKYGESILKRISEPYRDGLQQPLLALENEVLNVYRWIISNDSTLNRWEDLSVRASNYLDSEDFLLAVIYNNYALSLCESRSFEIAEAEFKKAIAIFRTHGESASSQLLNSLNNLSVLYLETFDLKKFQAALDECQEIRKTYNLASDQTLAIQSNALGIANQRAGKYAEAITFFELAIKLQLGINKDKSNDSSLILYLNNLAFNLFIIGEKEKATKCQSRALALAEKFDFQNSNLKLITLQGLISMYQEMGDNEKVRVLEHKL